MVTLVQKNCTVNFVIIHSTSQELVDEFHYDRVDLNLLILKMCILVAPALAMHATLYPRKQGNEATYHKASILVALVLFKWLRRHDIA